jgi:hypothetical protein
MHNLYNPIKILKNVIVALIQASEKIGEKSESCSMLLIYT